MKIKILFVMLLISLKMSAQMHGSMELIHYFGPMGDFSIGPIATIQNARNWYAEARYNYEDANTFSLYFGKAYGKESTFSYEIIPIIGGVIGKFNGGSAGLNVDMQYKRLFLYSQSQYTVSSLNEIENFFFSWTEAEYEIFSWCMAGVSMQYTGYVNDKQNSALSPGLVVSFSVGEWELYMYVFDPFTNQMMSICSIVRNWTTKNKK